MKNAKTRLRLWALTGLLSLGALGMSHKGAEADWHYNYTSTPAVASSTTPFEGYGNCVYSLPTGNDHLARVGVHFDHSWVYLSGGWENEFNQFGQSLGYSPEAQSYHQCRASNGATSWFASPFYNLWQNYHNGYSEGPNFQCPSNYPRVVGAYCFTRAWW